MAKFSRGSKAKFICDRSGFEYPYSEGVREPGTGLFVHKSETDGMWNLKDHPQNFSPKKLDDRQALKFARPDGFEGASCFLDVESGLTFLITEGGGAVLKES